MNSITGTASFEERRVALEMAQADLHAGAKFGVETGATEDNVVARARVYLAFLNGDADALAAVDVTKMELK